jgi:hypothetical protein
MSPNGTEQDALLHPGVDAPAVGLDASARRRAPAGGQRLAQLANAARASSRRAGAAGDQRSRCRFAQAHARAPAPLAAARARPEHALDLRFDASAGDTIGSRNVSSSSPSPPSPTSPDRVRLDEVDRHQRQDRACSARAAAKSLRSAASTICDHLRRNLVRATEMMPLPPIAISGSVSASSPDSTRKSAARAADLAHLRHVARGFLHADDVRNLGEPRERRDFDVTPVRPGIVVDDDRQRRALGECAVCW